MLACCDNLKSAVLNTISTVACQDANGHITNTELTKMILSDSWVVVSCGGLVWGVLSIALLDF